MSSLGQAIVWQGARVGGLEEISRGGGGLIMIT